MAVHNTKIRFTMHTEYTTDGGTSRECANENLSHNTTQRKSQDSQGAGAGVHRGNSLAGRLTWHGVIRDAFYSDNIVDIFINILGKK